MKKLAIALNLIILSSSSFSYDDPYEQHETDTQRESEFISPNFKESSFYYQTEEEANNATSYCYKKTTSGVCAEIEGYMLNMAGDYMGGAHEYMDIKSCASENGVVTLQYDLVNDYNDHFKVTKTISKCK